MHACLSGTVPQVAKAKPKEKDYMIGDGGELYLRIYTTDSKLWIFKFFRPYASSRSNISIGARPFITLVDARKLLEKYFDGFLFSRSVSSLQYGFSGH